MLVTVKLSSVSIHQLGALPTQLCLPAKTRLQEQLLSLWQQSTKFASWWTFHGFTVHHMSVAFGLVSSLTSPCFMSVVPPALLLALGHQLAHRDTST